MSAVLGGDNLLIKGKLMDPVGHLPYNLYGLPADRLKKLTPKAQPILAQGPPISKLANAIVAAQNQNEALEEQYKNRVMNEAVNAPNPGVLTVGGTPSGSSILNLQHKMSGLQSPKMGGPLEFLEKNKNENLVNLFHHKIGTLAVERRPNPYDGAYRALVKLKNALSPSQRPSTISPSADSSTLYDRGASSPTNIFGPTTRSQKDMRGTNFHKMEKDGDMLSSKNNR